MLVRFLQGNGSGDERRTTMKHTIGLTVLILTLNLAGPTAEAQLANAWIVPAAAHVGGIGGTFWRTDLSIHNPQQYELPVIVQALQSDRDNSLVPTMDLVVGPWQTVNLWDVFGGDGFDIVDSGAILVYVPPGEPCSGSECDLLVTSRTYTVDPAGGIGEFGQGVSGATILEGTDWVTFGYAAGILNDDAAFRCNVGVASWTPDWTQVRVDVQDDTGAIVDSQTFDVPPFGHRQSRLRSPIVGGSLVYYLLDGPQDALVFPYASVVDQDTGDPSYVFARYSGVGVTAKKVDRSRPSYPGRGTTVVPKDLGNGHRAGHRQ
jgi:hypothetical protein